MSFLSVITTAWLLSAGPADPVTGRPLDEVSREVSGRVSTLSWRDADDTLDGFIQPAVPVAGQPFEVNLRVRAQSGAAFEGPVVLTVRRAGQQLGESVTVAPKEGRWGHTFTVDDAGSYQLDIGFRSTRMKVVHATFDIRSDMTVGGVRLSTVGLVALAFGAAVAIAFSVLRVFRGRRTEQS